MKHESYTAQLLKLAEIPAETYADPVSRKELRNAVNKPYLRFQQACRVQL